MHEHRVHPLSSRENTATAPILQRHVASEVSQWDGIVVVRATFEARRVVARRVAAAAVVVVVVVVVARVVARVVGGTKAGLASQKQDEQPLMSVAHVRTASGLQRQAGATGQVTAPRVAGRAVVARPSVVGAATVVAGKSTTTASQKHEAQPASSRDHLAWAPGLQRQEMAGHCGAGCVVVAGAAVAPAVVARTVVARVAEDCALVAGGRSVRGKQEQTGQPRLSDSQAT
jgi:hypothetical protein